MKRILLIEGYDFEGYPTGGGGTFCDQLIHSFGNEIALVGITTSNADVVGCWGKKVIRGVHYDYLPIRYVNKQYNKKPLVPARLKWFLALRKYKKEILSFDFANVFIQSQDTLLAIHNWKFDNICYSFAGLANPLSMSRYKWARIFDRLLEFTYIPKLKKVNTIIAAAGKSDIEIFLDKVKRYGFVLNITQFPTRVDSDIFYPTENKEKLRKDFSLSYTSKIIVTTGRLSEVKGWRLLLDSFYLFLNDFPDSYFIFVGNGQDKDKIEQYIIELGIIDKVKLVGYQNKEALAKYLNIADLFVMGSYFEGWPTSMVEALACGIPVCSTNFGSAKEILHSVKIGLIVTERSPSEFSLQMQKAMQIEYDELYYREEIAKYSTIRLKDDLLKLWPLL